MNIESHRLSLPYKNQLARFIDPQIKLLVPLYIRPIDQSWESTEHLPDFSKDSWVDEVKELQRVARDIPIGLAIILAGDMITEEGLPLFQTAIDRVEGFQDQTGIDDSGWATWLRKWTAQEKAHGDVLQGWMSLSGIFNLRKVKQSVRYFIENGMNTNTLNDPVRTIIYTNAQERATKISHSNTGRLLRDLGDHKLAKICSAITGQEGMHEGFYGEATMLMAKQDPDIVVIELENMWEDSILMPAARMDDDGKYKGLTPRSQLFDDYAMVAQSFGVYTAQDYVDILKNQLTLFKVETRDLETDEAKLAREKLLTKHRRWNNRLDQAISRKASHHPDVLVSWVDYKPVSVANPVITLNRKTV